MEDKEVGAGSIRLPVSWKKQCKDPGRLCVPKDLLHHAARPVGYTAQTWGGSRTPEGIL